MDSVPCKPNVEKMIFQEKLYILLPDKRYPPAEAKKSNEGFLKEKTHKQKWLILSEMDKQHPLVTL